MILLKYIKIYLKVLRHVSILRDHLQGVCLYRATVTGLFKNLRIFKIFFKILKFLNNPVTLARYKHTP